MTAINVKLNGELREVPNAISIDHLLELFSLPRQRVAIEINGTVVPRSRWVETVVQESDKIEVVHFVGGG